MNRKYLYLNLAILLMVCVIAYVVWDVYCYYTPPTERMPYQTRQKDDTIRIAYIGDSWAYLHSVQHNCIIPEIINGPSNLNVKLYSYGLSGRTSKQIYEAIFDDRGLKQLFQKQGCDYCIISAGINDICQKMSTRYYTKSMDGIISFMLDNNIRPIIIEIPDFDVYNYYQYQSSLRKIQRHISMLINNIPFDCKNEYRGSLSKLILDNNYQDKVSIIRYKTWNNNYSEDLKSLYLSDGIHLNEDGYVVLDSIIAKEILNSIKYYDHRY